MTRTNADLGAVFDAVLAQILTGALPGCPTETGLDFETVDALNAVAAAVAKNGDVTAGAQTAVNELEKMFDGTHAREYWLNAKFS